jgi:hypothetical protein
MEEVWLPYIWNEVAVFPFLLPNFKRPYYIVLKLYFFFLFKLRREARERNEKGPNSHDSNLLRQLCQVGKPVGGQDLWLIPEQIIITLILWHKTFILDLSIDMYLPSEFFCFFNAGESLPF